MNLCIRYTLQMNLCREIFLLSRIFLGTTVETRYLTA
jgi:hypothetical protein